MFPGDRHRHRHPTITITIAIAIVIDMGIAIAIVAIAIVAIAIAIDVLECCLSACLNADVCLSAGLIFVFCALQVISLCVHFIFPYTSSPAHHQLTVTSFVGFLITV